MKKKNDSKQSPPGERSIGMTVFVRMLALNVEQGIERLNLTLMQHTQKCNPQSPLIDYTIVGCDPVDPEATLLRAETSLTQLEFSVTVQALNEYFRWRRKGGYEPCDGDHRSECVADALEDCLSSIDMNKAAETCSRGG